MDSKKAAAYEKIAREARERQLLTFCRTYEGDSTAHNLIKRLDALIHNEIMPRYAEMFVHSGLGEPSDSVVWQLVEEIAPRADK